MKIKQWVTGLLTLATLTMPAASIEASTLDSIQAQEETKQDELQALESEINQALNEINAVHASLADLEVEIEETEQFIAETQTDIVIKEEEVEKRTEVMKENLRNIQTNEMNHSMIISILNSESLTEMFNRIQVLATLHSASNESFENAQTEHNELLALKEKNESEKEKLENDKATVQAQELNMSKKVADLNTKLEDNKEELTVLAERKKNEESRLLKETELIEKIQAMEVVEDNEEVVQLVEAASDDKEERKETEKETIIDTSSKEEAQPVKMNNPTPKPAIKKEKEVSQAQSEPKSGTRSEPKPAPKTEQPKSEPVQPKQENKSKPAQESNGRSITVVATAYSTNQPSLSTHTATGIDLRSNPNVIAVDPNVIPLNSLVEVPGYGVYIAGDTGGAIKGNRIDIHITDLSTAQSFGYQTMNVKVLN